MHHDYDDIRSLIAKPPLWFDEHAVPRYQEFSPDQCADIYCDEAALVLITCQACGETFHVAFSRAAWNGQRIADEIQSRTLHFGDPPNVGCCASGPTMNSEPRRVLEYWRRNHREFTNPDGIVTDIAQYIQWRRLAALERDITPEWVEKAKGG